MIDIAGGKSTPRVLLDSDKNIYLIEGQSYPQNSSSFYRPVIKWLQEYISTESVDLKLKIKLLYINTSSAKAMLYIFDLLDVAYKEGKNIKIDWLYDHENEMAKEAGEELLEDLSLPYNFVEV